MAARLKGKEKLKIVLRALSGRVRLRVAAAVARGANEIVTMQKHLAPVGHPPEDEHPGQLRGSVGWKWASQDPVKRRVADPNLAAVISAGGAAAPHALHVELGTQKMSAEPFFRPGFRAVRKQAVARVNKAIRQGIKDGLQ